MKKIIFLLLLPLILFGQHFTETFSDWVKTSGTGLILSADFDSVRAAAKGYYLGEDLSGNANHLTASGFSANYADELSVAGTATQYSGGDTLKFTDADLEYFYSADADFAMGSNSFTISIVASKKPAGLVYLLSKGVANYYLLRYTSGGVIDGLLKDDAGTSARITGSVNICDGASNYLTIVVDRTANLFRVYVNGVEANTAQSIATFTTLNAAASNFQIGKYQSSYYSGSIELVRVWKNRALSTNEIKEDAFLAPGWVSKQSGVTRKRSGTGWEFSQGINGSGLAVKVGNGSYISQVLTASSVTYSMNLGAVNLSSDSIFIATDTDTLTHTLSDSTLPDGNQWTLSIDAHETGGVVYVDNLSLTTSAIPATETQDKGFKEYPKFPKIKGLK